MIPHSEWKWYGDAAHFICGAWCRFHLATEIGEYLVSTVGLYVHPRRSQGREDTEQKWLSENPNGDDIGCGRKYETMVFQVTGHCEEDGCKCGHPLIEGSELDMRGYNDRAAANSGHRELCEKWAAKVVG